MQTNVLQMKEKKLINCGLVGETARYEDNQGPQWANAITFIIKDEQEVHSLILSAQVTDAQLEELETLGITTVIAVQEDWELNNNPKNLPTLALSFPENVTRDVHRIADHTTIDETGLETLADKISKGLELGSVLVHCKSGRGRSAQAIVAYLIKYEGLTPKEAMDKVKEARRFATFSKKTIKVFEQFHEKLEQGRSHPL
jgi:protein-tyrosine phosphatase